MDPLKIWLHVETDDIHTYQEGMRGCITHIMKTGEEHGKLFEQVVSGLRRQHRGIGLGSLL